MSADQKRVSFMTIDSSSDFVRKTDKDTTSGGKGSTIRVEVDLFEPDEYKFPDYNYKKLMFIEKKKLKKITKLSNGGGDVNKSQTHPTTNSLDDPFNDNDDDVARIAKEMEAKYGAGSSYSKTKTVEYDRGLGYDENDSFIDNTEAYDEVIPEDIETDRGGFYVNSGLLEFKKTPNFERPGDEIRMPKAKKRVLSSSSESEAETNQNNSVSSMVPVKSKKKKASDEKKASSSSDEQGKAAKKIKKDKKDVKEVKEVKEVEKKPNEDEKKQIKTTTVKDMLRLKRDNLAKKIEAGKSSGGGTTTTTDNDDDEGSESVSSLAVSESSRESGIEPQSNENGIKELTLPNIFSSELIQSITSLKNYADTTARHNTNFFDNTVKEQLLAIDNLARLQGSSIQVQVYKQLENFIPCPRKNILTKVARFRVQAVEGKVKAEVKKLKMAVNSIMPDFVKKYDEELKEFEGKKNIHHIMGTGSPLDSKMPRRKFHWNDNLRQILYDLIQVIGEWHKVSKSKKEPLEEVTLKYLKENVLPLWPDGWIKIEDFGKELERKKKREMRGNLSPQTITATNGKSNTTTSTSTATNPMQKTEMPMTNGKASQQQQSVIKRSSDHSINSIINSTSPLPPHSSTSITSSKNPSETSSKSTKPQIIELDKMSSQSDILKVSKLNEAVSADKIRISDGSDSDCAIIDSPVKSTSIQSPPKPQQHFNEKNSQSSSQTPQQQQQQKESKKHNKNDYSNLISSFAMLTGNSNYKSSVSDQRKLNTHVNGINDTTPPPLPPPSKAAAKSYTNNLQYAINDMITTSMMKGKSSDYQKQYTTSLANGCSMQNVSVITSTTDVNKSNNTNNNTFTISPALNLSNKK